MVNYPPDAGASLSDGHGKAMIALVESLFPICRSITGNGVRQTLAICNNISRSRSVKFPREPPCSTGQCRVSGTFVRLMSSTLTARLLSSLPQTTSTSSSTACRLMR
jgi:hypothetical protein